jgi:hypothetical protein
MTGSGRLRPPDISIFGAMGQTRQKRRGARTSNYLEQVANSERTGYRRRGDIAALRAGMKAMKNRKSTGRLSFEDVIRPVVKDFIERGAFKDLNNQNHKAGLVLKVLGHDPADPPSGFSKATISRIFRAEWSKWQEAGDNAALRSQREVFKAQYPALDRTGSQ